MIAVLDRVAVMVLFVWLVLLGLALAALVFIARSAPTDERPMPMPTSVPGPPVVAR